MGVHRNTLYNLAGALVPVAIGLITVPAYLGKIGEERYGVLAIVWLFLGNFGFFDLGLSRATANFIAKLKENEASGRQDVFWTALGLNAVFGIAGGATVYAAATSIVVYFFKIPPSLQTEVLAALPWMAAAVPLATLGGVLTGSLEGRERFASVNLIQSVGSVLIQVIPLLIAIKISSRLDFLIPATVLARSATMPLLFIQVARCLPLSRRIRFERSLVRPLLGFGGWVAATFFIIPIMETIDKLIIGAMLGARAVTYYTVPFNLAGRMSIFPKAVMRSLFPVFSRIDEEGAAGLAAESVHLLCAFLTPLTVAGVFLMAPFLKLWVGSALSLHASPLGETLILGIWMNGLAHIPFAYIEGRGRPDILTKLHLVMLPFFFGALWAGARWNGLEGVAMAWSFRVWVDAVVLLVLAGIWKRCRLYILSGALFVIASWVMVKFEAYSLDAALLLASMAWSWASEPKLRRTARGGLSRISVLTGLK